MTIRRVLGIGLAAALAACSSTKAPVTSGGGSLAASSLPAGFEQDPPFSRRNYGPFARGDAVAIALREWRLWGEPVDDDPPGARPPPLPSQKPERFPGLWERVGEYWWEGENSGSVSAYWTGKHDASGQVFPASQDASYAWSAAFISYVMRVAGAKDRFPYSPTHSDYINAAKIQADQGGGPLAITAEQPQQYAPRLGDLICESRSSRPISFADLPTASTFPGHCDMVVGVTPGQLTVIGGNVDDSVTEKHVPTTQAGLLADPVTGVVDARYPWFVVLRVSYDTD